MARPLRRGVGARRIAGHVHRTIGSLQRALYQMLLQLAKQGERVAVMVDEAHRLSGKVLEGLRLLSNLDTEKEKLMCLLFVGQPELERKLSHHALRPLSQRISIRFRLPPFDGQETTGYIQHRLWIAGHHSRCPIPKRVMMLVHYMSGGVPRCINQLCDRALLAAYSHKKFKVSFRMMWRANREIAGLL